MKYLKEGKWSDFQPQVETIFKKIYDLKKGIVDLNTELKSEIAECMVDVEDYAILSKLSAHHKELLCSYEIKIPVLKLQLVIDLLDKLDEHIGKRSDEVYFVYLTLENLGGYSGDDMHYDFIENSSKLKELLSNGYNKIVQIDLEFFKIENSYQ